MAKSEPVRETVKKSIGELKGETPKRPKVGLATNPKGVEFRCGTCEYFDDGVCRNEDPELNGEKVDGVTQCCDLYDHPGMEVNIP